MGDHYSCRKCLQHYDFCKCHLENSKPSSPGINAKLRDKVLSAVNLHHETPSTLTPLMTYNDALLEQFHESKKYGEPTFKFLDLITQVQAEVFQHKTKDLQISEELRDAMMSEATMQVLKVWHRFRPDMSSNIHAFLTTVMIGAFIIELHKAKA